MPAKPVVSWSLVAIQFGCLATLALTGPLVARPWPLLLAQAAGIALLGWSAWSVRRAIPNVLPDVRRKAALLRHGPYRWIRHPMYAGLLLLTLPMLMSNFTALRAAVWALFLAGLLVKIRYEERLLAAHFPEYAAYQGTNARLIPYIY